MFSDKQPFDSDSDKPLPFINIFDNGTFGVSLNKNHHTKGYPAPRRARGTVKLYPRIYPNARRNEPCPCGSGKKHKKCCIDKRENTAL